MEVIWTRNQPLGNKPPSPLQLELVVKEANFLLAQMVKTLISLSLSLSLDRFDFCGKRLKDLVFNCYHFDF
jgi:hypothetical protein